MHLSNAGLTKRSLNSKYRPEEVSDDFPRVRGSHWLRAHYSSRGRARQTWKTVCEREDLSFISVARVARWRMPWCTPQSQQRPRNHARLVCHINHRHSRHVTAHLAIGRAARRPFVRPSRISGRRALGISGVDATSEATATRQSTLPRPRWTSTLSHPHNAPGGGFLQRNARFLLLQGGAGADQGELHKNVVGRVAQHFRRVLHEDAAHLVLWAEEGRRWRRKGREESSRMGGRERAWKQGEQDYSGFGCKAKGLH